MGAWVTARAPGKVNVQLLVGALRGDGYHPLASVFHAVGLTEEVTVEAAERGSGIAIEAVTGPQADEVPTDGRNLAWRAIELLADEVGRAPDVRLRIAKGVPVAGGMAGGSADAAAALVAANALWATELGRGAMMDLALALGSDVPFNVLGGTALGLGRGEQLSPLLTRGTFHWVFATAHEGLSTPQVYATLDRLGAASSDGALQATPRVVSALIAGDAAALGRALVNDLQEPAFTLRPRLRDVLDTGLRAGALGGMVSGSGPTLAFLVRDPAAGRTVAAALAGMPEVRSTHLTTGPEPGARVVARSR